MGDQPFDVMKVATQFFEELKTTIPVSGTESL